MDLKLIKNAREKFLLYTTLNVVPAVLLNRSILVDLQNGTSVAGIVDDVDP